VFYVVEYYSSVTDLACHTDYAIFCFSEKGAVNS